MVGRNATPLTDESVDAFLSRHFGPNFARTIGSALVHGIYATDSRLLSVRSAFSAMCELEEAGKGSVIRGALYGMLSRKAGGPGVDEVYELGDVPKLMKGVSVFSFQNGMQTLTDAMAAHLAELPHVSIMKGDGIEPLASYLTTMDSRQVPSLEACYCYLLMLNSR